MVSRAKNERDGVTGVVTTNVGIHDEMVEFLQSVKTVRGTRDNMFGFGFDMSARTE